MTQIGGFIEATRRPGVLGVHSLDHFSMTVPDLEKAKTFYESFGLDVHNAGGATAWNARVVDRLPDGLTGGMCDAAPTAVTVQVFAADGVTPVSPVLVQGTDYSLAFAGAPTCELTLEILSAAGAIGEPVFVRSDCGNAGAVRQSDWRYRTAAGGGSLLNIGSHAADLLRYVTGREVERIAAVDDSGAGEVDELSASSMVLDGGIFAQMLSSRRLPFPDNGVTIHATRGYIRTKSTISYDIAGRVDVTLPNGSRHLSTQVTSHEGRSRRATWRSNASPFKRDFNRFMINDVFRFEVGLETARAPRTRACATPGMTGECRCAREAHDHDIPLNAIEAAGWMSENQDVSILQ